MKTLYISDMDGTLLDKSAAVSKETARVLNKIYEQSKYFTVATARTAETARYILSGVKLGAPAVLMNGVLIYDFGREEYIKVNALSRQAFSEIIARIRELRLDALMYELRGCELVTHYTSLESEPLRAFVYERKSKYGKVFVHSPGFECEINGEVVYFALLDTHEKTNRAHTALGSIQGVTTAHYKDVYSNDLWFAEAFCVRASKQNAARFLREKYGFERLVGFGDNLNDLPLFAECDLKIAVQNAREEVRAAADIICGANHEHGVAKWLESNAL